MLHDLQKMRNSTLAARLRAIERVVDAMQRRPCEPMSLRQMARIALMSPFHFNRVFRAMTGMPPRRFLAALRIEASKRLLLETDLSVTSICFEVGYESLGSFITRFSRQVGTSPRDLRRLAGEAATGDVCGAVSTEPCHTENPGHSNEFSVRGRIASADDHPGMIFLGLFAEDAPQGRPIRCHCRRGPGEFSMGPVPDGQWFLFAVSFPEATDPISYLLPDMRELCVEGPVSIRVAGGRCDAWYELTLRHTRPTDPPILIALKTFLNDDHQSDDHCRSPQTAMRRRPAHAQAVVT